MKPSKGSAFLSCGQEKMIFFTASSIVGCCANLKTGASPHVGNYGPAGAIDIDELVDAKRSHLATVRRGEIPEACRDCPALTPHNASDDTPYLFDDINIGHHTACNTDCYYCGTNSNSAPKPVAARAAAPLLPVLKEMVERGYVDPNAIIRFGGGEPTILPEFEKLVDYFIAAGRRFFINSSGVRYSPAIERMLRSGGAGNRLVISIDSASRDTYELIKGFDLGKRVWDNIARYAQIGPDTLEVKYIVLPENAHETAEFVRKCHEIGVKRISIDLDSRPVIFGLSKQFTDEMVEGIAILILEAKRRGLSVYHSGSGNALWQEEFGERRVNLALARLSNGQFAMVGLEHGFIGLAKLPQDLQGGDAIDFGRCENATATPLGHETPGISLREDASFAVHRIEQIGIPVSANVPYTVEVVSRPRERNQLMIEFRDHQMGEYRRATFDLRQARISSSIDEGSVAVASTEDGWVRCQLTLTPASNLAVLALTLVNDDGAHIYGGADHAGIDIRPAVIARSQAGSAERLPEAVA
jgi:sulfatase maturation enzyme AslB (radical SAM superfamily)